MSDDLAFFGATADCLPAFMRSGDDKQFDVLAVNVPAYELWRRMYTQWRVGGMGNEIGLDYNVLFGIMDRQGLQSDEQLDRLDQVQLIETGYLNRMAEKRKRKKHVKR